ncbi:MAG: hypothetical protein MUP55_00565 [Candidatus Aenigmarchaeota archaeon]|nr:hypothetical protein [Candidatus Aenigmarchaeota archaeon]
MRAGHLRFTETKDTGKTKVFSVFSNHDDSELGEIKWHISWRCYVFNSFTGVIWSWDCLRELSDFIKSLMDERKTARGG